MKFSRTSLRNPLAVLFLVLAFAGFASAQETVTLTGPNKALAPNLKIKNFGQMDERFYRGAQPREEDYAGLAALGIKTVIDLREDPKDYERPAVEALGMRYVNIPMSDKDYPSEAQINQFLALVNDPATGKFYVHCAGGRHRTGVMGAVYRFNFNGWNFDQVYREMKNYDFYTRWGHGDMKKYVVDYWSRIQAGELHSAGAAGGTR